MATLKDCCKTDILKYGKYCYNCGKKHIDIVDELFKDGTIKIHKDGEMVISNDEHIIHIRLMEQFGKPELVFNHVCSIKDTGDLYCSYCGKKLEYGEVVVNDGWHDEPPYIDNYTCSRCGHKENF